MLDCLGQVLALLRTSFADVEQPLWQLVAFVLLLGLAAAVLVAPLLQAAYVRRVQRFMGFRELQAPPQAWWERQARRVQRPAPPGAEAPASLARCSSQRQARIRRATLAAWAVLALGGLVVGPLHLEMGPWDWLLLMLFIAVLGAQPALVNLRPEGSKGVLLGAVAVVTVLALLAEGDIDGDALLGALVVVVVPYLVCVQRTLRATVVPLAVLFMGLTAGTLLAMLALAPGQCMRQGVAVLEGRDWALLGGVLAGMVGSFLACVWLAARVLDGLAALVARGWLSELSVVAGSGVVLITGLMTLSADHPQATLVVKLGLWGLWTAAVLLTYGLVLRRQVLPRHGRRLLMLRVFSRDSRAERLLDTLQSRWQLAGPVLQIGGPDLVKLNLDIHEVIAFLNFRLHELFQPAAVPAEVLARSLDLGLDHEGRFRVNELFCFDTSWKQVVEQLLGLADVVLLDLRGFNPDRGGTAHEVQRLADRGLLPRVVALYDHSTDWAHFDARVARRGPDGQALGLKVDARDPQALTQCLDRLLQLADGPA